MKFQMLISINISRNLAFSESDKTMMLFFPLINMKMPTIVDILTFISRQKSSSAEMSMNESFITSGTV